MSKELYHIWKRIVSLILTVCLTAGLWSSQMAVVAYASTELPDENLGNGASEGTAHGLHRETEPGKIPPTAHTVSICADYRPDRRDTAKAELRLHIAGRGMPPTFRWKTVPSIRPMEVPTVRWKI